MHLVHPHGERAPVCDQEPLADVEFSSVNEQRSLYVLLHDPPPLLVDWTGDQLQYGLKTLQTHNACATSRRKWLESSMCKYMYM